MQSRKFCRVRRLRPGFAAARLPVPQNAVEWGWPRVCATYQGGMDIERMPVACPPVPGFILDRTITCYTMFTRRRFAARRRSPAHYQPIPLRFSRPAGLARWSAHARQPGGKILFAASCTRPVPKTSNSSENEGEIPFSKLHPSCTEVAPKRPQVAPKLHQSCTKVAPRPPCP